MVATVSSHVSRLQTREIIYLSLHYHHQNDSYIKMGSDESHFNVSVGSDGQSHRTVSTNHNLFEEKGEPKWYRGQTSPPSGGRRENLSAFSVDEVMLNVLRCQLTY